MRLHSAALDACGSGAGGGIQARVESNADEQAIDLAIGAWLAKHGSEPDKWGNVFEGIGVGDRRGAGDGGSDDGEDGDKGLGTEEARSRKESKDGYFVHTAGEVSRHWWCFGVFFFFFLFLIFSTGSIACGRP